LAAALAAACASSRAFQRGQRAAEAGDWELAVAEYARALDEAPGRPEYRVELERATVAAANARLDRAAAHEQQGDLPAAIADYRRAAELNPANRRPVERAAYLEQRLRDEAEAARAAAGGDRGPRQARSGRAPAQLSPASQAPLDLRFTNASTQDILNYIGAAAGINVTFEKDFRPAAYSIQLEGVPLEEALRQITVANQLWYKVLNDRAIFVIPDTAQKRQLYEEQVVRTFHLLHADPAELTQLLVTTMRIQGLPITPVIAANKAANTVTVRATRNVVDIIARLVAANDRPRAEILVDVEIREVSRSRAKQFGLDLSQYRVGAIFSPEVSPSGGTVTGGGAGSASGGTTGSTSGTGAGTATAVTVPPFNLNTVSQGVSTADFYLVVPQAVARFLASDSRSHVVARAQLRGAEGQKLTLNVGDEVPVPSTVFTPFAAGGVAAQPLTSFSYRNVGVNVELTPRVGYAGDVLADVTIESSTLGGNIDVGGQSLPTFGTRKATTRLRLREGLPHLLAGLLRDEDRQALRGVIGLMNLPILRQLVSGNDGSAASTEIVMVLTPRVVRTHELTQEDVSPIYIGSPSDLGLTGPPSSIGGTAAPPDGAPGPGDASQTTPPRQDGVPAAPPGAATRPPQNPAANPRPAQPPSHGPARVPPR
jgi:general secretion pathway protein D